MRSVAHGALNAQLRSGMPEPKRNERDCMEANIHKFQAFVKAAECGSFTRTAQQLGYTQSSVSRMVQGLEEDWGVRLFERAGGTVRLTKEGERLLPEARAVVQSFERLTMKVDDINGLESGNVSIAAPSSIVSWKLARPLGAFAEDHPNIEIDITESTYGEAEKLLTEGAVDVAFVPKKLDPASFSSKFFHKDEIVVVSKRGHFGEGRSSIPIDLLKDERFIADTETAPLLQKELRHAVVRCETSDFNAILALIDAGLGISLLPMLALGKLPDTLEIHHLEIRAFRTMYMVHRLGQGLSLAALTFLNYLREQ